VDHVAGRVAEAEEAHIEDGDLPEAAEEHVRRLVKDDAREGQGGDERAGDEEHGRRS
jgi:hypothetical protein